ncbi:MAG: glycosyltransferase [Ilumatobacteraceae bacterium]
MSVGYLVSQYPAASHTFIHREVEAVRAAGVTVHTFSVREPAANERATAADAEAFATTTYLLPIGLSRYARAHAGLAVRRPVRYSRTLLRAVRHRVPGLRSFVYAFVYFAEAGVLADELRRRGDVDRLHNHFANAGAIVGMLAAELAGVPWSLTLHGISETDYPAGNLLAEKIAAADVVACVSQFGRAQAYRLTDPSEWPKLCIVRCGIDTGALPAAVPKLGDGGGAGSAPTRLVCVGRLSPEKGHHGLIDAFATVVGTGRRATLALIGDGPERPAIVAQIERLGLGDVVELRDRLPERETLEVVAASDVLVLASFMEGLPVSLMEALALGRPVVAPRVAGVPELVVDGAHGLLFTPGDWDELAACLARLVDEPALRKELGDAGPARIAERFDVHDSAAAMIAAWHSVSSS